MAGARGLGLKGACVAGTVLVLAVAVANISASLPALHQWVSSQSPARLLARSFFLLALIALTGDWLVKGVKSWRVKRLAATAQAYQKDERRVAEATEKAQASLRAAAEDAVKRDREDKAAAAVHAERLMQEARRQRKVDESNIAALLQSKAEKDAANAESARQATRERTLLRMEQDEEYQEALRRDRELAEAKRRRDEEVRERHRQEEEKRNSKQERLRQLQASLPEEPPAVGDGITTIRLKLPDSSTRNRRFLVSDDVSLLHAWAKATEALDIDQESYALVTPFPRTELSTSGQALGSLGLYPQAVILLELP